jgi:hypothetical protein
MEHELKTTFDDFGWSSLTEEAERQGISVEELVRHAAMYYLSDLHEGRVAARILRSAEKDERELNERGSAVDDSGVDDGDDDEPSPSGRRFG